MDSKHTPTQLEQIFADTDRAAQTFPDSVEHFVQDGQKAIAQTVLQSCIQTFIDQGISIADIIYAVQSALEEEIEMTDAQIESLNETFAQIANANFHF